MKKVRVVFADEKIKEAFDVLESGRFEDKSLYSFIDRAINDIKKDPFCGIRIPKELIPKEYIRKYGIDNLWKYDLPNAWRLIYSIADEEIYIIAIVLEWLRHKDYEKRFGYKTR